jgi:RNA polymerase sigma-70 factor, ECF subfamily
MTDSHVQGGRDPSSISTTLLDRVRAADPVAWGRLIALYTPTVYGWCRRAGLQEADAEDVGQEVFRAVHRAINRFRREKPGDSFRGWLRVVTRNQIRDFARRKRGEPVPVGGSDAQRFLHQLPSDEQVEAATAPTPEESGGLWRRALELVRAEFSERDWQAFWRVAVEGQAAGDVAADLHTTPNVVYLAKSRIRARLEEEFGELLDEPDGPAPTPLP